MPRLPAICPSCGLVFPSPINLTMGALNLQTTGIASTCPSCGTAAEIPNGVWNAISDAAIALSNRVLTRAHLERLKVILDDSIASRCEPEEIKSRIETASPELKSVSDALPKNREQLYAFLAVLISAISVLLSQCDEPEKATPEIIINQTILNMYPKPTNENRH